MARILFILFSIVIVSLFLGQQSPSEAQETGTLSVTTTPVSGAIYVDYVFMATRFWTGNLSAGLHVVSFGDVDGYIAPSPQTVTVVVDQTYYIVGAYRKSLSLKKMIWIPEKNGVEKACAKGGTNMRGLKEVVVVDAVRCATGKSGRKGMEKAGQLCQASAQDLMANTLRGLLKRVHSRCPKFEEAEIENVVIGCLSQIGEQGINIGRIASLLAGIPKEAAGCTVNQYCNAGLKAINIAAHEIMVGEGDIMVCGGVEIMSHYGMMSDVQVAMDANYPVRLSPRLAEIGMLVPQGVCAEMISADQGHTREDLERFGMWSMQKAVEAERKGWYADHIVPYEFTWEGVTRRVERDEVLRPKAVADPEAYLRDLMALPTPFKENGIVSPGNSSQIVDGAAAVLLMSGAKAEALGLEPLCRIAACAVAGGEPVPMLLAPIPAVKKALKRAGKTIDDMDVIEPNEAFASPLLQFADELGYDRLDPRVNPTGGAIALGHPIGASGAMYFGEMVQHLKRTGGKAAVQMVCGGGGVGIATVVEIV